jgi:hypothetical protein
MGENFSSFSRFSLKVGLSDEAAATCEICGDRFRHFQLGQLCFLHWLLRVISRVGAVSS